MRLYCGSIEALGGGGAGAAGADVDAQDACGETPLRLAALNAFPALVKMLLCAGADVTLSNTQYEAPLATAKSEEHLERNPLTGMHFF